jgi:hypothetical protein
MGSLSGYPESEAAAINAYGDAAGYVFGSPNNDTRVLL